MNGNTTARRAYLELSALFIEREIAKFRRGEQAALVSLPMWPNLPGTPAKSSRGLARARAWNAPMPALAPICIGAALRARGRRGKCRTWAGPRVLMLTASSATRSNDCACCPACPNSRWPSSSVSAISRYISRSMVATRSRLTDFSPLHGSSTSRSQICSTGTIAVRRPIRLSPPRPGGCSATWRVHLSSLSRSTSAHSFA
jgi:hypothetical protein